VLLLLRFHVLSSRQATDDEKDEKMYNLLCELDAGSRVVVFANTKRRVDACSRIFAEFGSVAIHGDKAQHERDAALAAFSRGDAPLMFATDVAARGLDIKGVTHVMNFDMARYVVPVEHRAVLLSLDYVSATSACRVSDTYVRLFTGSSDLFILLISIFPDLLRMHCLSVDCLDMLRCSNPYVCYITQLRESPV
jgi:superfamily II DNA/RNA helicase